MGRYKYNKKLNLTGRLAGQTLSQPVADPSTGEILAEAGETISRKRAQELEALGVDTVWVRLEDGGELKMFSNSMVDIGGFVSFDCRDLGINERVYFPVLKEILETCPTDEEKREAIAARVDELIKGAEDAGLSIIVMHTGGSARRGDLSDKFITPIFEKADYAVVVKSGDEDGLMAGVCASNSIPVDMIDAISEVATVLPKAFK